MWKDKEEKEEEGEEKEEEEEEEAPLAGSNRGGGVWGRQGVEINLVSYICTQAAQPHKAGELITEAIRIAHELRQSGEQ